MSAPNTNLEKEARRHRGPLRGMLGVVLFALVLLAALAIWAFSRGGTPGEGGTPATGQAAEDAAAPLVQPEETTGADAGVGETPDTDPAESLTSQPADGGDAAGAPSPDD